MHAKQQSQIFLALNEEEKISISNRLNDKTSMWISQELGTSLASITNSTSAINIWTRIDHHPGLAGNQSAFLAVSPLPVWHLKIASEEDLSCTTLAKIIESIVVLLFSPIHFLEKKQQVQSLVWKLCCVHPRSLIEKCHTLSQVGKNAQFALCVLADPVLHSLFWRTW